MQIFQNKVFKIVYGIIKGIFFTLLAIYVIFILAQRLSNNSSIFGYRIFTVATGSMEPTYKVNDIISVRDVDVNKLHVGDDIAYLGERGGVEGLVISHRIIKIDRSYSGKVEMIFTKGINSSAEDPSITPDQVLGKVDSVVPIITPINHVIKNKYGFFFLVFCPLVLVICLEIAETRLAIRLDKEELVKLKDIKKVDDMDEEII